MLKSKYILFAVFLLATVGVSAQKAERDYIRKGNRLFNDSVFVDAEVNYRKANSSPLFSNEPILDCNVVYPVVALTGFLNSRSVVF